MIVNGRSCFRSLIGHNNSPTDVCDFDQHSTDTDGRTTSHVASRMPLCLPLIDRLLQDNWRSPGPIPTQLLHNISEIQANISYPPRWNGFLLDYAILESNYRSPTSSEEVAQRSEILNATENESNLDFAIAEPTDRSLTVLNELVQDGATQNDTANEDISSSRALTSRPSMDTQFATLIDIVRRSPLCRPELAPSDAISIASTHRSLDPTPFLVRVASAILSSGSYFHPCMTGPIVDRPMSHQDWHDEVCDWFGEESSVSSSYTNDSSETSTSDTACISSSSFDLSQTEHDRSLNAMQPKYLLSSTLTSK